MKIKRCPDHPYCQEYAEGMCDECPIGEILQKDDRKIKNLKAKNKKLQEKNEALKAQIETVAGKPARWNDAKYTVLQEIATAPDADVAPGLEVVSKVTKEIEDAINKRYDQHVFSGELEDTETEAVMDFHADLYFDIEKIKNKYGITDTDG